MQTRTFNHSGFGQRASARRRIRRMADTHRLYCRTNGCTTYLQLDQLTHTATCPVCGASRTVN
jgi:transcription initiation factor IIE alpha subunit